MPDPFFLTVILLFLGGLAWWKWGYLFQRQRYSYRRYGKRWWDYWPYGVGAVLVLLFLRMMLTPNEKLTQMMREHPSEFNVDLSGIDKQFMDTLFAHVDVNALFAQVQVQEGTVTREVPAEPVAQQPVPAPGVQVPQGEAQQVESESAAFKVYKFDKVFISVQEGIFMDEGVRRELVAKTVQAYKDIQVRTGLTFKQDFEAQYRAICALGGTAETPSHLVHLDTCDGIGTSVSVAYMAHEMAHQLAHDNFGNHMYTDLKLGEGFATWASGAYWWREYGDFRGYVNHYYGGVAYGLMSSVSASDRPYYEYASFVEYVVDRHGGIQSFYKLYNSVPPHDGGWGNANADYQGVLGLPINQLDEDWRIWLSQQP